MSSNVYGLSAAGFYALAKKNCNGSVSSNYVTLDTVQTITADKTFANLNVQNILGEDITAQGNVHVTGNIYNTGSMPIASDASTLVPTTAWVQSAITLKSMPPGSIIMYGGSAAPSGYVLCDGALYDNSQSQYAYLFAAIGFTYNVIPPPPYYSVYFNVPDLRGVYPGMPGTNVTSNSVDPNFSTASFQGPAALGTFQYQSVPFVPHDHLSDYPNSTNTAVSPGSTSYYKSGASQNHNTSGAQSISAPNVFTTVSDYVKPITLGINYIIKL
jgi:microcystin-dependent protein